MAADNTELLDRIVTDPFLRGSVLPGEISTVFTEKSREDVRKFGLVGLSGEVYVERYIKPADTLEEAADIFERDGVVVLSGDCVLKIVDTEDVIREVPVADLTKYTSDLVIQRLQQIWGSVTTEFEPVIRRKEYKAYNDTPRDMWTVSYANVCSELPEVIALQNALLPSIRRIVRDRSVQVSEDEGEGTVINLQLFEPSSPPDQLQIHGAHTDRVDTTVVICLDNVGPNGDFVYIRGYNKACKAMLAGLDNGEAWDDESVWEDQDFWAESGFTEEVDPHKNFEGNIKLFLRAKADLVTFRVYPVKAGTMLIARTNDDVHFITPKSHSDVQQGIDSGIPTYQIGELEMGRGIINAAYETRECRRIGEIANAVMYSNPGLTRLQGEEFFSGVYCALRDLGLDDDHPDWDSAMNACVTKRSAEQLYND